MDKVTKVLTDALLENDFIINSCEFKEGFLTERYEIRFSKDNCDYKIQIFEAVADYPGFINYNFEPIDLNEIVKFIHKSLIKTKYQIGKFGSSTGKDYYFKISQKDIHYDVYLDIID
ncbi:MAG: hypothetical protein EAX90_07485 [Candidatus Heimdallarchaeota archaeon]|nr:hypothetical protein [Candidatus Heimdallarchaeota archaeon]